MLFIFFLVLIHPEGPEYTGVDWSTDIPGQCCLDLDMWSK